METAVWRYELRDLVKTYRGRRVLSIGHLRVREGRTLALLGPSGSGKSTLLRLLNFLETADAGQLCYAGQPVGAAGPPLAVRRTITTVFQRPLLLQGSVWQNVAYGLWLRGRVAQERVEAALERVGLLHLARARAPTLSGGEAQRVALARALVLQPQVLLLDEPTANLDPANVALIEGVLQTLREEKITLVLVTHNLFQARRLADEAALLVSGELIESAPLPHFFEQPHDPRTAAFLTGEMVW